MRTLSLLLLTTTFTSAQDMPLHEILRPGEDWKSSDQSFPGRPSPYTVDADKKAVQKGSQAYSVSVPEPTCCTVALGGSTLLVGSAADRYVWAFRIEKDGSVGSGDRYCRLRVAKDDRLKKEWPPETSRSETSALNVDGAGRFYAATSVGIQVFDPTGRLCGVMTAPRGKITALGFVGDNLFAQTEDKVYVRRMLAEGAK